MWTLTSGLISKLFQLVPMANNLTISSRNDWPIKQPVSVKGKETEVKKKSRLLPRIYHTGKLKKVTPTVDNNRDVYPSNSTFVCVNSLINIEHTFTHCVHKRFPEYCFNPLGLKDHPEAKLLWNFDHLF